MKHYKFPFANWCPARRIRGRSSSAGQRAVPSSVRTFRQTIRESCGNCGGSGAMWINCLSRTAEADLLGWNRIETAGDLHDFTERISAEFEPLLRARGKQRNRLRRMRETMGI